MEHLSKFGQKLTHLWAELIQNKFRFNDQQTLSICVVSMAMTILVIVLAWRYTKRKQSSPPEKYSWKSESAEATTPNTKRPNGEGDGKVHNSDGKEESSLTWPCSPEDVMSLPNSCPLSHMYHMSQLSQLSTGLDKATDKSSDSEDKAETESINDPQEYISHIQSAVKRSQQRVAIKKLEEDMSEDQKDKEHVIQRKQLEAIYQLMEEQKDKFGISDIDDMNNQVKLYM